MAVSTEVPHRQIVELLQIGERCRLINHITKERATVPDASKLAFTPDGFGYLSQHGDALGEHSIWLHKVLKQTLHKVTSPIPNGTKTSYVVIGDDCKEVFIDLDSKRYTARVAKVGDITWEIYCYDRSPIAWNGPCLFFSLQMVQQALAQTASKWACGSFDRWERVLSR